MQVNKKLTGEVIFYFLVLVTGGLFYLLVKTTGNLVEKIQRAKKDNK